MKKRTAWMMGALLCAVTLAWAADGDLDSSFAGDGLQTTPYFWNGTDEAPAEGHAVAIQADGKIVVAGESVGYDAAEVFEDHFLVVRYNTDGSLDPAFDSDGRVGTFFYSPSEYAVGRAVAIQGDGKIVAAGYGGNNFSAHDALLVRYNPDGSLDASFGSGGKVITSWSAQNHDLEVHDMALQNDGKIVVGGTLNEGGDARTRFFLLRYNTDGSLDTGFDGDGKVETPHFGGESREEGYSVAIQSDGKIIIAGYCEMIPNDPNEFAMARYNSDGSLDTGFGSGGTVRTAFSVDEAFGRDVAIMSDGKILVAGDIDQSEESTVALARYNSNGSLDGTFGSGGKAKNNLDVPSNGVVVIKEGGIQRDGKGLVVGLVNYGGGLTDLLVARCNVDGSLDMSFGEGGYQLINFGETAAGYGMAIQDDDKIVVAGIAGDGGEREENQVGVARLLATVVRAEVRGNGAAIADGDSTPDAADHTLFDAEFVDGGSSVRTYTIANPGTVDLEVAAIDTDSSAFTVSGIGLPVTVAGGTSTTFAVTFDPPSVGVHSATVTVSNDASGDLRSYTYAIEGEGTLPPPVVDITNANASVYGETSAYDLGGTNNEWVVGTMAWTNALNGANGEFPVSGFHFQVSSIPLAFGSNTVTVIGTNELGEADSDSVVITRRVEHGSGSPVHYVATNGAAAWPYTNWIDAATTIQDAVDAASNSDTVLVSNGVYAAGGAVTPGYSHSDRVCIARATTVESVKGPDATVIDGGGSVRGAYLSSGTLSGFTLTNGTTWASGGSWQHDRSGGGLWLGDGAVATNCIVSGNEAATAGGVFLYNGGTLEDCIVANNTTPNEGGGVRCENGGTVRDCLIEDNVAEDGGGGIYLHDGEPLIERCEIRGNECTVGGADGGGIWFNGGGTARNCLVVDNEAANTGGGLYFNSAAANAVVENCTVVSNTAEDGGGLRTWGGTLRNCIVYENTGTSANDNWSWGGNAPSIEYTCTTPTNGIPGGEGCIDADPLFIGGDYRLQPVSPCIDAGTNAYASSDSDLDGNDRIIHGTVDMGSYEYAGFVTDTDGDVFTDYDEYVADTSATNSNDWFRIASISNSTVFFDSSSNRFYTLLWCTNLLSNDWKPVQGARMGTGGADSMVSTNALPVEFYKLEVQLP